MEMKGLLHDVMRCQKETHVRLDQLDKRGAASVQELPAGQAWGCKCPGATSRH